MATFKVSIGLESYHTFSGWKETTVTQFEEADDREVAIAKAALGLGAYNADRDFRVISVNVNLESF